MNNEGSRLIKIRNNEGGEWRKVTNQQHNQLPQKTTAHAFGAVAGTEAGGDAPGAGGRGMACNSRGKRRSKRSWSCRELFTLEWLRPCLGGRNRSEDHLLGTFQLPKFAFQTAHLPLDFLQRFLLCCKSFRGSLGGSCIRSSCSLLLEILNECKTKPARTEWRMMDSYTRKEEQQRVRERKREQKSKEHKREENRKRRERVGESIQPILLQARAASQQFDALFPRIWRVFQSVGWDQKEADHSKSLHLKYNRIANKTGEHNHNKHSLHKITNQTEWK